MEFTEGKLYRVTRHANHGHYRTIMGELITYTGSPTLHLASVTDRRGKPWIVYKRDLFIYAPENNVEATYLLRQEES